MSPLTVDAPALRELLPIVAPVIGAGVAFTIAPSVFTTRLQHQSPLGAGGEGIPYSGGTVSTDGLLYVSKLHDSVTAHTPVGSPPQLLSTGQGPPAPLPPQAPARPSQATANVAAPRREVSAALRMTDRCSFS